MLDCGGYSRGFGRGLVWGLSVVLLGSGVCGASEASNRLIDEGIAGLAAQNYGKALEKFSAAQKADPSDCLALFFQGTAFNRLTRYGQALERLSEAERRACKHADLDFELGWSLLKLKRPQEAVVRLERYDKAHPGRGQTSEFLGRAYFAQGDYAKAELAFQEAMIRDPALKPTVLLYLAKIAEAQNKPQAAQQAIGSVLRDWPKSPVAVLFRDRMQEAGVPAPPTRRKLHLNASLTGSYNSNAISLGTTIPLPQDIKHQHDQSLSMSMGAGYDLPISEKDSSSLGYNLQKAWNKTFPSSDQLEHFWQANYNHFFTQQYSASAQMSEDLTYLNGRKFRNQWGARPALDARWTQGLTTEVSTSFSFAEYYTPSTDVSNRNGYSTTLTFTQYWVPSGTQWQLRGSYSHAWNRTKGNDFDSESDSYMVGFGHPLPFKINADFSYTKQNVNYISPNSAVGFAYVRTDDIDAVSASLSRPLLPWLSAFASYSYNRSNANITNFNYIQYTINTGLQAQF